MRVTSSARRWLTAGLSIWHLTALARNDVEATDRFLQTVRSNLKFAEVERVARNHDFGEYRGGPLTLKPHVALGEQNHLGIDENGTLVQVLGLSDRTVAFPLSGQRRLRDVFVRPSGGLVAIDEMGELFTFDRDRWEKSPLREIAIRQICGFGVVVCNLAITTTLVGQMDALAMSAEELWIAFGTTVAASMSLPVLRTLQVYGERNNVPDGLRSLGFRLPGYRAAEGISLGGRLSDDYLLHFAHGKASLREVVMDHELDEIPARLFDHSCERTLARGVPFPSAEP